MVFGLKRAKKKRIEALRVSLGFGKSDVAGDVSGDVNGDVDDVGAFGDNGILGGVRHLSPGLSLCGAATVAIHREECADRWTFHRHRSSNSNSNSNSSNSNSSSSS